MKPEPTHGGSRPNAGRKKTGRKPYLIRMKPKAIRSLKKSAKQSEVETVKEYLEKITEAKP